MRSPGSRSSRFFPPARPRRKATSRSIEAKRVASCFPLPTPRASTVRPGTLKRTCPSATRWSMPVSVDDFPLHVVVEADHVHVNHVHVHVNQVHVHEGRGDGVGSGP